MSHLNNIITDSYLTSYPYDTVLSLFYSRHIIYLENQNITYLKKTPQRSIKTPTDTKAKNKM